MSTKPDRGSFLDALNLYENRDIVLGLILFVIGWCVPGSSGVLIGVGIAVYFLIAFWRKQTAQEQNYERPARSHMVESNQIQTTVKAPVTTEPTIAEKIKAIHMKNDFKCPSCGATVLPTDFKCRHCGSVLIATVDLPRPEKWDNVEVGQSAQLKHPEKGNLDLSVTYRVYYGELWQAQMKQGVPWTLTGSYYVGLGLENGIYLLNWQGRFYLLESNSPLTDKEINQIFAKPAREFAASNQSKNVSFTYNKLIWNIEDIGRFRIEWIEGEGAKADPGAVGRFIHAKSGSQVLVLEDYQSNAGGIDHLWMGYQIEADDIHI